MPNRTLNSVQYFYQSQGQPSANNPALVLLHGSGGDSSVWSRLLGCLAYKGLVIAIDLPGHGKSHGSPADSAKEYALWLKQLIDSLKIGPFVLAGHSLGGSIAQQFAEMFPEMLRGLILIGTGMCFEIQPGYLELLKNDFSAACLASCREAYAKQPSAHLLAQGRSMLQNNGANILLRDLALCNTFDSTAWACMLKTPCLIICGKKDTITPCILSEQLAHAIPDSILKTFDEAGHMVMQEKPKECNNEIVSFIHSYCGSVY